MNWNYNGRPNTVELRNCVNSSEELFNFDYKFYTDDKELKKEFEDLFYQHYYFREIGQETWDRFKFMLRTKLNTNMKLYSQLYQSEIEAYNVGWLNQKDLTDTFQREVDNNTNIVNISEDNTKSKSNSENNSFFSDTPSSKIDDIEKYMSNASRDKGLSNSDLTSIGKNTGEQTGKTIEKTIYNSKGQIGVNTVAQPVQWWREQMINLNLQIIEDCADLFYLIY